MPGKSGSTQSMQTHVFHEHVAPQLSTTISPYSTTVVL